MNTNKVKSLKYRKTLKKSIAKPLGNQLMKITMTKNGKNEEFYFGQDVSISIEKEFWKFFLNKLLI